MTETAEGPAQDPSEVPPSSLRPASRGRHGRSGPGDPETRSGSEVRGLRDHLGVIRRQGAVIGVSIAAALLIALVASLAQQTKYEATTEVLVPYHLPASDDVAQQVLAQRSFDPNRAMQDEARIAVSASILGEVRQRTGGDVALTAKPVKDADVLNISATADSAERAQAAADAAAEIYLRQHNDKAGSGAPAARALQPAPLPSKPSQPQLMRNLVLALVGGLAVGLVLAYAVDALRDE